MAYRLPDFPISCGIYTPDTPNTPAVPSSGPRVVSVCNLAWGRRVNTPSTGGTSTPGILTTSMTILLPALTDIRGPQDSVSFDMVEVPAGSGRWYQVTGVDDIGKGFANEHRAAHLFALAGSWVAPYG